MAKKKKTTIAPATEQTRTNAATASAFGNFFVPIVLAAQPTYTPTVQPVAPAPAPIPQSTAPVAPAPLPAAPAPAAALPIDAIKVSNAAELLTALKNAKGGETIALNAGNYGDVTVTGIQAASKVTITSVDAAAQASFRSLAIVSSKNIAVDTVRVDYTPDLKTVGWSSAVRLASAENISLSKLTIKGGVAITGNAIDSATTDANPTGNILGLPTGRGITIEKSSNITVENSDISSFMRGIALADVTGLKILNNEVHNLRTSPLVGAGLSNILVEGNHFHDSNPWKLGGTGDHGDLIHFWTQPNQVEANTNITIKNNFFAQGKGAALLGIFLESTTLEAGFKGVTISNNVIHNGDKAGVRLENVQGVVENNTFLQSTSGDYKSAPGALVLNNSNIDLKNNFLGIVYSYQGAVVRESNNVIVQRFDSSKPGYYASIFTNALVNDPKIGDLAVKATASPNYLNVGVNFSNLNTSPITGGADISSLFSAPLATAPAPVVSAEKYIASAPVTASTAPATTAPLAIAPIATNSEPAIKSSTNPFAGAVTQFTTANGAGLPTFDSKAIQSYAPNIAAIKASTRSASMMQSFLGGGVF